MQRCYAIRAYGRVQSVLFRYSALRKAKKIGLVGFVRNEPDDSVYAEVQGNPDSLQAFITWFRKGPPWARVDKVEIKEKPIQQFTDFHVLW